jgi:hypothetical protein
MAPSPPRTLSRVEFEQLLQRAVERHAKDGPRTFSEGELVEAGRELGIDGETVRAVYLEHQREQARDEARTLRPPERQRPFDSKLTLVRDDTFTLTIPPRTSFKVAAVLVPVLFAALLAGVLRIVASPVVPAIVGGVGALISLIVIQAARTTRQLVLNRDGSGLLVRERGGRQKGIPLQAGQVHARLASREIRDSQGHVSHVPFVALDHGTQTHDLLENYSHAEQAWAVDEIERWLGR